MMKDKDKRTDHISFKASEAEAARIREKMKAAGISSRSAYIRAMALNGNYDLAYIGLGRALLRQKRYKEAMEYFEVKYDDENYSKAFKQYRKEWVEDHIVWIIVGILVLFLVPMGIGKIRALKHEIDTDEFFELQKQNQS